MKPKITEYPNGFTASKEVAGTGAYATGAGRTKAEALKNMRLGEKKLLSEFKRNHLLDISYLPPRKYRTGD